MKIDINHPQTTYRYPAENLVWLEVTFSDIKGQNHIAYDASAPNMIMHAKNQVNRCSG